MLRYRSIPPICATLAALARLATLARSAKFTRLATLARLAPRAALTRLATLALLATLARLAPLAILALACSDDSTGPRILDDTPPDPVSDLRVASAGEDGVVLEWTATGDDGRSGRVSQYDVRYSAAMITGENWSQAVPAVYADLPNLSGITEDFEISGLTRGTWYFALRSADEAPNWSEISNVASGFVGDVLPPATVMDLLAVVEGETVRLTWTAPGDDGVEGMASEYDVRRALTPITEESWDEATRMTNVPTPSSPGTEEILVVEGLVLGETHHFALRTADDGPNWSAISNSVSAALVPDEEPPAAIADLAASGITGRTVVLTWTAPGDDGDQGVARAYDLRHHSAPIDEGNWGAATPVDDLAAPARPGEVQSVEVSLLEPLTDYWFAIRTADEAANVSALSNVVPVSTGDAWQLTRSPLGSGAFDPQWSPDGKRIAFSASWDGDRDLYVMDVASGAGAAGGARAGGMGGAGGARAGEAGGEPVQLTDDPAWDADPAWSPDGKRIAFFSRRGHERDAIWVMDAVPGAEAELLSSHADTTYLWNPDWSPDGTTIAYGEGFGSLVSPFAIWSIPAAGGTPQQLVAPGGDWGNWMPDWSPDGTRLAILSTREFSWDIFVVPLDGSPWTRLTFGAGFKGGPSWSPDGARIAYQYAPNDRSDIYIVPAEGGTPVRFTNDEEYDAAAHWAPSGDRIAYHSNRTGQFEIWVQLVRD